MSAAVWGPLVLLALLVLIDQAIKLVIWRRYRRANRVIWRGKLRFKPVQNTRQSWLGDLGVPLFSNRIFAVIIKVVTTGIFVYVMHLALDHSGTYAAFAAFGFAGSLCSLIDSAFWDGSIDYIRIEGRFTFDLKDVYLVVFMIAVVVWYFAG